jgi:hypothetical protein
MRREHSEWSEQGQDPKNRQSRGSHLEPKERLSFDNNLIREHSSDDCTLREQDGCEGIGSRTQEAQAAGAVWMRRLPPQIQQRDTPEEPKPDEEPEIPSRHDELQIGMLQKAYQ